MDISILKFNRETSEAINALYSVIKLVEDKTIDKPLTVQELVHLLTLGSQSTLRPVRKALINFIYELDVDQISFFKVLDIDLRTFAQEYQRNSVLDNTPLPTHDEDIEVKSSEKPKKKRMYRGREIPDD